MKIKNFLYFFYLVSFLPCYGQLQKPYAPRFEWYDDYDVKFYKIDIEVDDQSSNIKGYTEIVAETVTPMQEAFRLELSEFVQVDSAFVNGQPTTFRHEEDFLDIILINPLQKGTLATVKIYYNANENSNLGFFSAVSNNTDYRTEIPVTWTLSEPLNAKYWFPCKQDLTDKADSAYIFVTVPENLKAGAPGILTAVTPLPDGKLRYEWKTFYPVAFYLLSFAVADYQDYTFFARVKEIDRPIPVQNYIYNDSVYFARNKANIDTTASLIRLYSQLFIPYPFADEKYGHCTAPMGGGMEHQTMTTLSAFSFLLVAHELAHQWFGNYVTCATFQDIWINEGFASYAEYLALEYLSSPRAALSWMRDTHSNALWAKEGSVFVPADETDDQWRIFDMNLSYKKGAALVHNIRGIIGDDAKFFDVLRGFLKKYAFSVATGMDFMYYLQEQTGIDFTRFFEQWYFGEGHPVFDISWKKANNNLEIMVEHAGSASETPLFITDLEIQITNTAGKDTILQLPVRTNSDFFSLKIPGNISNVTIDPKYWVLKQLKSNTAVRDFPTNDSFVNCIDHVIRKQNLDVTFSGTTERNCRVKLTDAAGDNVFTEMTVNRKKTVTIPMEQLPNSSYLLYVQNGKNLYIRKIVKTFM